MACGVLPAIDKQICAFERWLISHLTTITDPDHDQIVRRFATWYLLPQLWAKADHPSQPPPPLTTRPNRQHSFWNGSQPGKLHSPPADSAISTPGTSSMVSISVVASALSVVVHERQTHPTLLAADRNFSPGVTDAAA
ncbi:hypothetical protein ACQP2U_23075 [Nocardia sp. CA-084685]|uniref:hypothetical protein n=1 Tax=Nocardia sp. CA-084685 TaxID=3239970 RepID=UPI003D980B5C